MQIIDNGVNDVRIVGIIALIVMIMICAIGMEWESKVFILCISVAIEKLIVFVCRTSPQVLLCCITLFVALL